MTFTAPILDFQSRRAAVPFQPPVLCSTAAFPLLLAGVPALRKTPGLATIEDAGEAYFTSVPFCLSGEGRQAARAHLEQVFGITDRDSLVAFCQNSIHVHREYLDFESFWEGRPAFPLEDLTPQARERFQSLSDFARPFQPMVGRRGFLAWDISETLGHLRSACACELISMEEYRQLSQYWVEQAAAFHSWTEYAVGLVCGASYWAFRMGGEGDAASYRDLNLRLAGQLLDSKQAWAGRIWPRPQGKAYKLSAPELRPLLTDWTGPSGCLATDEITVSGRKVGYCYREQPGQADRDSGWRFFAGDEDEAYLSDPSHLAVYDLNTICNYDPDLIPLLGAPYGSAYARGEDGAFHFEPLNPPDEKG